MLAYLRIIKSTLQSYKDDDSNNMLLLELCFNLSECWQKTLTNVYCEKNTIFSTH